VIDSSVVLRRLLDRAPEAGEVLLRDELSAPSIIVAEVVNGLVAQVRFGGLRVEYAEALLAEFFDLPIALIPDRALASEAVATAARLALSAYDAVYVTLAAHLGAPLVTADQRLAAVYEKTELIP
jgi:predicted nucleic acid-binding protein